MARANLTVSKEVQESFIAAQEESSVVRALKIRITDEEMVLSSVADASGSTEEDFNSVLVGILGATEASIVLFCGSDVTLRGKRWILVSWIPDGCRVRDKMLYASSREDLKRTLGIGHFTSEYAANQISDVNWESYQTYIRKDLNNDALMTESERLMKEEHQLARVESVATKSTAMVLFPLTFLSVR
jgi:twinfilin-like protein